MLYTVSMDINEILNNIEEAKQLGLQPCFIYGRVSDEKQVSGVSLMNQSSRSAQYLLNMQYNS